MSKTILCMTALILAASAHAEDSHHKVHTTRDGGFDCLLGTWADFVMGVQQCAIEIKRDQLDLRLGGVIGHNGLSVIRFRAECT